MACISPGDTVQCVYDDGKAEHRVCIFKDIVLWEGQLLYVAKGECFLLYSTEQV